MSYVDGYVLPVPKKNLQAYRRMAQKAGKIWREHGALDYKECAGEDLKKTQWSVPFSQMMKLKPGETVVFAYIVQIAGASGSRQREGDEGSTPYCRYERQAHAF